MKIKFQPGKGSTIWFIVILVLGVILLLNYSHMSKDDLIVYIIAMLIAVGMLLIRSFKIIK